MGENLPKNEDGSITVTLEYEGKVTFKNLGEDGWWGVDSEGRLCALFEFIDGTFDVNMSGLVDALEDEEKLSRINKALGTNFMIDAVSYGA